MTLYTSLILKRANQKIREDKNSLHGMHAPERIKARKDNELAIGLLLLEIVMRTGHKNTGRAVGC